MFIDIKWYEWLYWINKSGEIYSYKRNIIMTQQLDTKWYKSILLYKLWVKKMHRIHRLLALMFIDNKDCKPCINHINWIRNDNTLSNLEWCTYKENADHAVYELHKANFLRMKKVIQKHLDWSDIKVFNSIAEASKELNINKHNIWSCCNWNRKTVWWYIWEFI
jgi:hypothetical protein